MFRIGANSVRRQVNRQHEVAEIQELERRIKTEQPPKGVRHFLHLCHFEFDLRKLFVLLSFFRSFVLVAILRLDSCFQTNPLAFTQPEQFDKAYVYFPSATLFADMPLSEKTKQGLLICTSTTFSALTRVNFVFVHSSTTP